MAESVEVDKWENAEISTIVRHVSNEEGAVPKRQRTLASMMTAARLVTKRVKVRKEDQLMNAISVMEPAE